MTGSRCFAPAMYTALTLTALGLACAIGAASAQDPAFIGGSSHNDPANVQSRGGRYAAPAPARSAPPPAYNPYVRRPAPQPAAVDPNAAPLPPEEAMRQIQDLMNQLNSSEGVGYGSYNGDQRASYERSMRQASSLMTRNNNQFSASTKAVFLELQAMDADLQRDRNLNPGLYDGSNPEAGLDNGTRQVENGMNRLNDVLMPMLQDMKQAWDTELRNAATKRRP
jgi:hypothetical protein